MSKKNVLIVNCGRNGLGIIRSLGQIGCYNLIAIDHKKVPAFYSKYVNTTFVLPDRVKYEKDFIDKLIDIGKEYEDKVSLIPTNDEYVDIFIRNIKKLERYYDIVCFESSELLENTVDKEKVYRLLLDTSISLPRHFFIDKKEDIVFPVIIKPSNKQDVRLIGKEKLFRIKICTNLTELESAVSQLNSIKSRYVIQEIIEGEDNQLYTCGIVADKGVLKACFTGRKLRQFPPKTGEASYAESIEDDRLIELAKVIASKTNFTGISQIEFKYANGRYFFIEMNPRSWSWNSLSTYCGVNLPLIALSGSEMNEIVLNSRNGKWIFAYEDFLHNVILNRNVSLFRFIKDCSKSNTHAYFHKKDLAPFFRFYIFGSINLIKHFIKMLINKNR